MAEVMRHMQTRPMRSTAQQIMDRWRSMQAHHWLFGPDWDDIVDLIAPMCAHTQRPLTPGQSRTKYMFDSTAMSDMIKLTAHLMGNVVNQAINWHQLQMQNPALRQDQEVQSWLSAVNDHHMSVYDASNFYQSWHTSFINYVSFGTMAMFCGDASVRQRGAAPGLVFQPVPHGTYGIIDDEDGNVRTLFRLQRFTPWQAERVFQGNISDTVREQGRVAKDMDAAVTFLHAVFPRDDWKVGGMSNKNMPFASIYMEVDTQHINAESGYHEFPYAVARWEKLSDTPWGFGPGHMALPYTRSLNRLMELNLQMLALYSQPPLKQVHEGVLGNISFEPLAINVVKRQDDLMPIDLTGRPDLVQIGQEDLRQSLHDIFYISGLEAIPPADESPRTAFEISQRIAMQARLMGPAFHRLSAEAITPLVDRVFGLEFRKGRIPPPPVQVLEAAARGQGQIDIEYIGPLASSQKGADAQSIVQIYALAAQILQARQMALQNGSGPHVMDLIDDDMTLRKAADAVNLPPDVLRGASAVALLRQAREQVAQQQQAGIEAQQTAATLKDVAPFLQVAQGAQAAA